MQKLPTPDEVRSHALETFGEETKANHWLNRPNALLGGNAPAELLTTDPEAVDQALTRIDHGIYA